jgi:hypothetical protein
MLKLSLLLLGAVALNGNTIANAERPHAPPTDAGPTDAGPTDAGPTDSDVQELGAPTYWDLPSCHSYDWMKNHGKWLCAIHGEVQIMFDPRHQSCGSLYGSFWHQCAYQI